MGVIQFKLSEVMGRHRIKQRQLADVTHLRPAAIHALYNGTRERVDLSQLAAIIEGLNTLTGRMYTVADLLEYSPVDEAETKQVLADHPDILDRVKKLESGQSRLIPIEEVAARFGVKL